MTRAGRWSTGSAFLAHAALIVYGLGMTTPVGAQSLASGPTMSGSETGITRAADNTVPGAPVEVTDDMGVLLRLPGPARRIVSLAPHLTELMYAVGGGDRLVGAVDYSDYPPEARRLPRVGSNTNLDLEKIIALKPDLILVWRHGNAGGQIEALKTLHLPLYFSRPAHLEDVAGTLRKFGRLIDRPARGEEAAANFEARIRALRTAYAGRPPVSVFYQAWGSPLMTLSGKSIVDEVITLCGGRNIFASLNVVAPTVSIESVLAAAPQAIVAPSIGATPSAVPLADLSGWRKWRKMPAVAAGNLFTIDGDLLNRPTPRLAAGATALCQDLEQARERLGMSHVPPSHVPLAQ